MIEIPQPSMALNAVDAPGARYKMWNTYDVPEDHDPIHILGWCAKVASEVTGGLKALVINSHGFYNKHPLLGGTGGFGIAIGTGIRRADTEKFSVLRGKVNEIWINACAAARISIPGTAGDGDGNLFCSEIAKASGAYVIAPTQLQRSTFWLPENYIDDFEGQVLRYDPSGGAKPEPMLLEA